jgi:putative ABC transport system permease protein
MFDLEKAIKDWRNDLGKIESFEDGSIAELESHLQEEIDRLIKAGFREEEAFRKSVAIVGTAESIGLEYYKTIARPLAGPPSWKASRFSPGLIWNYIKSAVRKGCHQKAYSFINVVGLTVGMTCCLLLLLWIQDELSYDRFHINSSRIYRVEHAMLREGRDFRIASTSAPLAPALMAEFPEIEKAVRIGENGFWVVYRNSRFMERIFFADPDIFEIFSFPLIKGNPESVLQDPYSLVISEEMGRKYFGEEDPLGKILNLDGFGDFKITGVLKNIPQNSHLHFGFLGPFTTYAGRNLDRWGIYNYYTYVLTRKGFEPKSFEARQAGFVEKYQGSMIQRGINFRYVLQPLTRIHLYSHVHNELGPNGDIRRIMIFSAVALFILLIACFNYINFATASYAARTREVGIRKVIGANKKQIIGQFLGESLLISLLALILAYLLAVLLLPAFDTLSAKRMTMHALLEGRMAAGMLALMLLTGLLAGSYPAAFFSSIRPAAALHGPGLRLLKASALRNSLVIAQFAVSIGFITATLIMARQMSYIRNTNLGLDKEHVIIIPLRDENVVKKIGYLKNELSENPDIIRTSASSFFPGESTWNQNYWREGMSDNEYPTIRWMAVDYEFLKTLGIQLAGGRDFSRDYPSDAGSSYILNESAVKEIGLESPIGKQFKIIEKGTVIGIVKDFHFDSLHQKIEPLALYIYPSGFEYLSVRIRPGRTAQALGFLKKKWDDFAPGRIFEYSFLDEDIDELYKADIRLNKIFTSAAGASILVACLGLFGLAALTTRRRTKEIGIRKVLGASSAGIAIQLSKEYLAMVLVANLIAWPLTYYAMEKWLLSFAYRTSIDLGTFIISALFTALIALLTVSYQSTKTALANPVESLRYE